LLKADAAHEITISGIKYRLNRASDLSERSADDDGNRQIDDVALELNALNSLTIFILNAVHCARPFWALRRALI
jgi:hypothetical protein